MPSLQRRQPNSNLRRAKMPVEMAQPMIKTSSHSSSDDATDMLAPKQLSIPRKPLDTLPARYESDEESVSPCPEDFEDSAIFSDVEFDSSIDLDFDESPTIVEVKQLRLTPSRPTLVNITKLAPIERRSTPAHLRPAVQAAASMPIKTSIGRTVVMQSVNSPGSSVQPAVIALQRPPLRFRAPPPVPPRNEARMTSPATPTVPSYPPPKVPAEVLSPEIRTPHAPRPSVSTVDTSYDTDDGDSSVAGDSVASSAPSSVADDADLAARYIEMKSPAGDLRKGSSALREQQEAELERAINDYMMWRSEGSPGEPPETVYRLSREDKQLVRDHEEEEWRRELERGLATPTPTSYAAYDPYGIHPPSLAQAKAPFSGQLHAANTGRIRGFKKMVKRSSSIYGSP